MTSQERVLELATARRIYAKPPVLEAVVDVQVVPSASISLAAIAELGRAKSTHYPVQHTITASSVEVDPHLGTVVQKKEELIGYRLTSVDGKSVVQFRTNGFAFSRLRPYDRWEEWRQEAESQWRSYRDSLGVSVVHRMAVRYINRIDLPLMTGRRLRDYFRVYPALPDDFPSVSTAFVMRVELRPVDADGTVIINMGRVPSEKPNVASVLLDLDLFRIVMMSARDDDFWAGIESLHDRANILFEGAITDLARELFDQ